MFKGFASRKCAHRQHTCTFGGTTIFQHHEIEAKTFGGCMWYGDRVESQSKSTLGAFSTATPPCNQAATPSLPIGKDAAAHTC